MKREGDSATLVVFSQSGIGRAPITTTSGRVRDALRNIAENGLLIASD